jgi:catechol 2,3-dioxygenase-like lactoylglutathione lyase family enzyme
MFGGKVTKYKGQVEGINYGGVWLLGKKGDATPSAGHAIDHIGFRPINVDNAVAAMKAKNVKVTTEPRDLVLASGTSMRLAFIEGPDGVRIELVQRR